MANMHFLPSLGYFVGFTDFKLQSPDVRANRSSLPGLVSMFWNSPACFQLPLLTYSQGLPLPFPHAGASAIHHASSTFAFVSALAFAEEEEEEAAQPDVEEGPTVLMVVLDVSSPSNATLIQMPSNSCLPLASVNASVATFHPLVAAMEPSHADISGAAPSASFVLVQSRSESSSTGSAAPAVLSSISSGFGPAAALPFFPDGAAASLLGTDSVSGKQTTLLVGVERSEQTAEQTAFLAAPLATPLWSGATAGSVVSSKQWKMEGRQIGFVPLSAVHPSKAARQKNKFAPPPTLQTQKQQQQQQQQQASKRSRSPRRRSRHAGTISEL